MINRIYRVMVPAPPVTKQRSRSTKAGHHFTPAKTENAEAWIRLRCVSEVGTPVVPGPVGLRIAIFLAAPSSMPKILRGEAAGLRALPLKKPDFDNAAKLVCDALNGIAWQDDAHIADGRLLKFWAPPGQAPCTVIEWWHMEPGEVAREGWRMLAGPLVPDPASLGLL